MAFKVGAVIVCAGKGKRLKGTDKAILPLRGKPLFFHATNLFARLKEIKEIVLVIRKNHFSLAKRIIKNKKVKLAPGGVRRRDSVYNGLAVLGKDISHVLIHDGARPFLSREVVNNILKELKKYPAVICGIAAKDTLKNVNAGFVKETLSRDEVYYIQTPQGFRKDDILEAYKKVKGDVTDDAQLFERMGKKVKIVEGSSLNIKITYPEDVVLARKLVG
ncbi:MAG: 2-C-methyl-D-erythritol 4-phosphate cytidylyltransferase [Candidatus Omnitrophota bacterium]|nr:MAG: 2-C-methyl-D-erythritol 4-phosphate cytidylyltransferase [Candidatus Omnitrophota bacterium]